MRLVQALRRWKAPVAIAPTVVGQAFGGGFYYGKIVENGNIYWLVVANKSAETSLASKPSETPTSGTSSIVDGRSNTIAMAAAGSLAAQYCLSYVDAFGNNDYFLAARDEWEPAYRYLKTAAVENTSVSDVSAGAGINNNAVPATSAYSPTNPWQTSAVDFRASGPQAFQQAPYLTSTQATPGDGIYQEVQLMDTGRQSYSSKVVVRFIRPIRKILATS